MLDLRLQGIKEEGPGESREASPSEREGRLLWQMQLQDEYPEQPAQAHPESARESETAKVLALRLHGAAGIWSEGA